MNELYEQHPWKSINKFMPFALNKGFTKSEVKKFFRETNPTRLSQMEIEFWKGKNNIPQQIMKYKGLK